MSIWRNGVPIEIPVRQAFWSKVNTDGPISPSAPHLGKCWLWKNRHPGNTHQAAHLKGYGSTSAHKLAYLLTKGPVPPGLVIDHLCSTMPCVRPSHLEVVTVKENARRALVRGPRPWPYADGYWNKPRVRPIREAKQAN